MSFGLDFKSAAERLAGEEAERLALVARKIPFSVKFLDDALMGILPHDVILLGASTGVGKTALASMIAQRAAVAGKRVHYFALEAEPKEIERRIKYRCVTHWIDERGITPAYRFCSYRQWYHGLLKPFVPPDVDHVIEEQIGRSFPTLFTYYRGQDFKGEDVERLFLAIQDQTDLIILDHFHYVDVGDDENESRAQKRLITAIRALGLSMGRPIIVVAHLRKKQGGRPRIVPELDDFMGSSDLTKNATQVILIAKGGQGARPYLFDTYAQIAKDRMDGAGPWVARLTFNARTGRYEDDYDLGRIAISGDKWEQLPEDKVPRWARKERQPGEDG